MAKKIIKLPSLTRVIAGSIALLELPLKPTYQNITFNLTGTGLVASMIKRINVNVNGNTIQTFVNLQRLIYLNAYYNRSVDTVNEFMIHFKRDEYQDLGYKRAPALGTADLTSATIEIELDATAPANITIAARGFVDTVPQNLGVFNRIREIGWSSSVVGVVETDKLPKGGAVYQAVHLFKTDISNIELELNQVKVIDASKAYLERAQKQVRPVARVPQTAVATHIDFLLEGDAGDLLDTTNVQDLRLRATFDSVGNVDIVTEQLDQLSK